MGTLNCGNTFTNPITDDVESCNCLCALLDPLDVGQTESSIFEDVLISCTGGVGDFTYDGKNFSPAFSYNSPANPSGNDKAINIYDITRLEDPCEYDWGCIKVTFTEGGVYESEMLFQGREEWIVAGIGEVEVCNLYVVDDVSLFIVDGLWNLQVGLTGATHEDGDIPAASSPHGIWSVGGFTVIIAPCSTTTEAPTTTKSPPPPTTDPPLTTTTPSPSATTTDPPVSTTDPPPTPPPTSTTGSPPNTTTCPCSCICELPEVPTTPSFPPAIPILTTRTEPPIVLVTSTPPPVNPLTDFIITTPPPVIFITTTTTTTTTTITTPVVKCDTSCNNLGF